MEVFESIKELREAILSSLCLPWMWKDRCVIRRDQFLKAIKKLEDSLPEECKQAKELLRERDSILSKARHEGKQIELRAEDQARDLIRQAQEEADRLIDKTNIVAEAKKRASTLIQESVAQSRDTEKSANEYAEKVKAEANSYGEATCHDAENYALSVFSKMERDLATVNEILSKTQAEIIASQQENLEKRSRAKAANKPPVKPRVAPPPEILEEEPSVEFEPLEDFVGERSVAAPVAVRREDSAELRVQAAAVAAPPVSQRKASARRTAEDKIEPSHESEIAGAGLKLDPNVDFSDSIVHQSPLVGEIAHVTHAGAPPIEPIKDLSSGVEAGQERSQKPSAPDDNQELEDFPVFNTPSEEYEECVNTTSSDTRRPKMRGGMVRGGAVVRNTAGRSRGLTRGESLFSGKAIPRPSANEAEQDKQ